MALESFWRHFGDILDTFWYLDGFWRHFGEFLDTFWKLSGPQLDTSTEAPSLCLPHSILLFSILPPPSQKASFLPSRDSYTKGHCSYDVCESYETPPVQMYQMPATSLLLVRFWPAPFPFYADVICACSPQAPRCPPAAEPELLPQRGARLAAAAAALHHAAPHVHTGMNV